MDKPEDSTTERLLDHAALAYVKALEETVTRHPELETLVAFQEGRLSDREVADIRRHLVVCSHCSDEILRLDAFDQAETSLEGSNSESADRGTAEAAAGWERFQQELGEKEAADDGSSRDLRSGSSTESPRPVWMLAASVLLAVAGSFAFFLAYQQHGETSSTIGDDPYLVNLFPDGEESTRTSDVPKIAIPKGMDSLLLRLLLGDQTQYRSYAASLGPLAGETHWQKVGLQRQPSGEFLFTIPRSELPAGDYVVRLTGEREGAAQEIAAYTFHILDDP